MRPAHIDHAAADAPVVGCPEPLERADEASPVHSAAGAVGTESEAAHRRGMVAPVASVSLKTKRNDDSLTS